MIYNCKKPAKWVSYSIIEPYEEQKNYGVCIRCMKRKRSKLNSITCYSTGFKFRYNARRKIEKTVNNFKHSAQVQV